MSLETFSLVVLAIAFLGGYTLRFQSATLYWGRRMAGEKSLESELEEAGEGEEGAYRRGMAMGQSMWNRGFQDAITPQIQNVRNIMFIIGAITVPIIGLIYQRWYVSILGFAIMLFLVAILKRMLPNPDSDFFKRRILSSLRSRAAGYERRRADLKAEAAHHMIMLLDKTEKDTTRYAS